MYLIFMFALIPAVLTYTCIKAGNRFVNLIVLCGGLSGILVSACTAFFSYMHRIPEYSFMSNFLYFFLKFYFVPMVLLYAVYFLCTKDELSVRLKAFFPLTAAFFAIYMPYCIYADASALKGFFFLFVKPVLCLSMIFYCSVFVNNFFYGINEKKGAVCTVNSICFLVASVLPAVLETMWLLNIAEIAVYAVSVVYSAGALVLFFVKSRQEGRYFF